MALVLALVLAGTAAAAKAEESPLTLLVEHSFVSALGPWESRGAIPLPLAANKARWTQSLWNLSTSQAALLAPRDGHGRYFVRLQSAVGRIDGHMAVLVSAKLDALGNAQTNGFKEQIEIWTDERGVVIAANYRTNSPNKVASPPQIETFLYLRRFAEGPVPTAKDPTSETEGASEEIPENAGVMFYMRKYWYYIVPMVLLIALSSAPPEEGGAGGGARR
eukprot:TRINITY_DN3012_c0_g1_i2.p1 TRINITY_DN3012_c0_g1~~TRINITY_DN3012_c0_g1_i2.p1  ORF type:complete len:220 (-),score=38.29 TRINITY_DN3012_c0_g1_i2:32-691(-)